MRYTDQPRPIVSGYSLAQHLRDHFQPGNAPASCDWCHREATYVPPTPRPPVRRPWWARVPSWPLNLAVLTTAAWATLGPPLSGRHLLLTVLVAALIAKETHR